MTSITPASTTPASTPATLHVTRSWGSHGVSVYGFYWERWTGCSSEEMTEEQFAKESEQFESLLAKDWSEMRTGDQRSIFHLRIEETPSVLVGKVLTGGVS